jgi:hypothetical protein
VRFYCPRRPDFADVDCGLAIGAAAARVGTTGFDPCGTGPDGRLREKSGMLGRPFFFIESS